MEKFWTILIGTVVSGIGFFSPVIGMVYLMIALVLFDTITAIIRDIKNKHISGFLNNLKLIKSAKLRRSGLKLVFYVIFLLLIYATEITIFTQSFYITNVLCFIFAFTEIKSIAENIDICLSTDMFTTAVKKIRKLFENKTAKIMSAEEKIKEENI